MSYGSPLHVISMHDAGHGQTPRNPAQADSLVAKAVELIQYFKTKPGSNLVPREWGSTMLWGRDVAKDLTNYVVLDDCEYNGPGYRKRTRVAHSDYI